MGKPVIGSYKGSATITLAPESKWPFTFGVAKARLILEHIVEIEAFIQAQPQKPMATAAVNYNKRRDDDRAKLRGEIDPGELAQDRWNEGQGGR
mgnify:CR=1 FL=1